MSCGHTDPAIVEFLVPKPRELGLDPVVAQKESTCLIYNRVWAAIKREVMMVLADNVGTPEDVEKLFRSSFLSQGAPCDVMDKVGLETVCKSRTITLRSEKTPRHILLSTFARTI